MDSVRIRKSEVPGTGCANCKNTLTLTAQVTQARGVAITLEKVDDRRDSKGYGVMSTPSLVINSKSPRKNNLNILHLACERYAALQNTCVVPPSRRINAPRHDPDSPLGRVQLRNLG